MNTVSNISKQYFIHNIIQVFYKNNISISNTVPLLYLNNNHSVISERRNAVIAPGLEPLLTILKLISGSGETISIELPNTVVKSHKEIVVLN